MKQKLTKLLCSVFFVAFAIPAIAQSSGGSSTRTITGKVTDSEGAPIVGAVVMASQREATTTNSEGRYTLTVQSPDAVLRFSCMGYRPRSENTASRTVVDVSLETDNQLLEDVVVVGYGVQKKVNLTGSVASIDFSKTSESRSIISTSAALAGLAAGMNVTQSSGQPGSDNATIRIRGDGSFTSGANGPLVLVDGVEWSMDNVNPNDIASISVLKDAASASIYGTRAANGVILITTKKGRSGRLQVEYNGYVSVQQVTRYPDLLGSVDYMNLYNEACLNSGQQPRYSQSYIEHFRKGDDPALYPDRDWADFYFKPAILHNHYVKLNGGTDQLAYTLSMGYLGQDGILEGTEYDKYNFRINTTSSLFKDRLKISANVAGYSGVKNDLVDGTGNTLYRIVAMSPMVNAKMEGYGWTDWFYDDAVREAGGFNKTKTGNFSGNLNLQLSLLKNLRLEGAVNYDRTTETGQIYAPNVDLYKVFTGTDGTQTCLLYTSPSPRDS